MRRKACKTDCRTAKISDVKFRSLLKFVTTKEEQYNKPFIRKVRKDAGLILLCNTYCQVDNLTEKEKVLQIKGEPQLAGYKCLRKQSKRRAQELFDQTKVLSCTE